ncbi:MAG: U32 family peptidase [Ruminococcaceae bacterium]|nr:U32 family peptidase [Oscillospiraceae bacterium]
MMKKPLPELLAPAGTPKALAAAIEGGADAVYFGGPAFNARMRAQNFTADTMRESIALCHAFGVRAYVTLNTLITDRELPAFLEAAREAVEAGADALIVADLGAAAALHRAMPDVELHASTQASGHAVAAAHELRSLGFSRMVLAREASAANMQKFAKDCGMETEIFVHGALCVSHSGQCLFSSLVGGRSGNRGECAQPCRLPDKSGRYPLSLKDLSLARHVPDLIDMGVHSLKIEGRLKSPEYVRDVVRIWRRLLDERRAATDAEMKELAAIFSRDGFTDGYFTERIGKDMLGVRRESDKEESRAAAPFTTLTRRIPLTMHFTMHEGLPVQLTVTASGKTVSVSSEPPVAARTAPMGEHDVREKLSRLGGTPYELTALTADIEEGLLIPVSRLNALRREALAALSAPRSPHTYPKINYTPPQIKGERVAHRTARFQHARQIPDEACAWFEHIYLPLAGFDPPADGVVLPAVIFDSERENVQRALTEAVKKGAKHALVGNIAHLSLALEAGLMPHGDFRLNVTNSEALAFLLAKGFADVLLSPELTLPQIRDIGGPTDAIVYGRIPLMTLEKCVGRELGGCEACHKDSLSLTDRRGERFPVLREAPHRSIIVNSRPTGMSDKRRELLGAGVCGGHFIFTTETKKAVLDVIAAYREGRPLSGPVRRI